MEKISLEFKTMKSLDAEEKNVLKTLTNNGRSYFYRWIDQYYPLDGFYVTTVSIGDNIIGWSAADMVDQWNVGKIGVFISPEQRGNGYAKLALEILLRNLEYYYPENPEYIWYMENKESLFGPIVKKSHFKPLNKHLEEYFKRYDEMNKQNN